MDRPTFSSSWSRVSRLTPSLRSHAQIHRQLYRGQPWHIVHDPLANQFFRLNPVAYHFVGLLDGKRTVDQAWELTLDRYGDAAPTQNEVIGLLGQLNESNLLRVDLPPDAEPLLRRRTKRRWKHWGGQAMSILFLRMPMFNPDKLIKWLLPLFRPLLSKWGLMAWLAWIIYCGLEFLPNSRGFLNDAHSVLAPANWGWMAVLFIVTKVIHELGHGLVCRRFGGIVPEVGIMMLVLFPFPYVDATSSWNFPTKWKRLLVAAAGMIFELAIAGGAALVWLHAEPGSLQRQLAYNVVFMASLATILFNGNPLLRFDGYYMLSDLLEVPNLYERSKKSLQQIVQKYAYGMKNVAPVSTRVGEKIILFVYGIASQIYRVLVLFGILWFISGQFFTVGLILAAWSLIAWLMFPAGKFVHWLVTSPALHEQRGRAVAVTIGFVAILIVGLGVVPMPERRRATGVVESEVSADIAVQTGGFVLEVNVEAGQKISAGQVILVADDPDLRSLYEQRVALRRQLQLALREALAESPVQQQAEVAKIKAVEEELAELESRLDDLVLRSPQDGVLISGPMNQLLGQYLPRGQVIGRIVDLSALRVTSLVDQSQNDALFSEENGIESIEMRTIGQMDRVLESQLIKRFPSGRMDLPHPALGYGGGGDISTRPDDEQGRMMMQPHFELWLDLPAWGRAMSASHKLIHSPQGDHPQPVMAYPGQRVYVRFTLERRRPLLAQWIHRLRQIFRERVVM